ncbi:host-nuclease inhibitor Gam family protein [Haloferula sargassicola]|uniref:NYN domain-containing protein n=1 Tax=Haloferula sargassicola TaxID=490096 RepID=A0ABP9UN33_9BACT
MKAPKTDSGFADIVDQLARDSKALEVLEAAEKRDIIRLRDKRRERIDELKTSIKAATKGASSYLRKFKDRLIPKGRKSAETQLAEYGLRSSSAIVALSSDWDEQASIEACLEHGFDACVVTVHRLDKEALEKLTDEELAKVGRRRRPSESFWLKPKTGADSSITSSV